MKKIKTYGVMGLMEWQPILHIGKATFRPEFTGGTMSAFGTTPATYTTKDPVIQRIIEDSAYYKSGRIELIRENVIEGSAEDSKTEDAPEADATAKVESVAPEADTETMQFASTGDAANYLNETFGIPKMQLRSRAAVQQAGADHNINITFTD